VKQKQKSRRGSAAPAKKSKKQKSRRGSPAPAKKKSKSKSAEEAL
jgi:hypothetical protein